MAESRAICSATTHEAVLTTNFVASTTANHPNAIHPPGKVNFSINVPPRPDLILSPPREKIAQTPSFRVPTSLLVERTKILCDFGILEANLNG